MNLYIMAVWTGNPTFSPKFIPQIQNKLPHVASSEKKRVSFDLILARMAKVESLFSPSTCIFNDSKYLQVRANMRVHDIEADKAIMKNPFGLPELTKSESKRIRLHVIILSFIFVH